MRTITPVFRGARTAWIALAILFAASLGAPAQTNFSWTNASTAAARTWSSVAWTNTLNTSLAAPVAGGSNNYILNFVTSGTTTNDRGAFVLNVLSFGSAQNAYVLNTNSGSYLIFVTNSSGGAPQIQHNAGQSVPRPVVINSGIILSNTTFITGTATNGSGAALTNSITIAGIVSGPGGIVKTSADGLTFSNNNTYTGGTIVSNGWLSIGAGGAAGWVVGDISLASNASKLYFNRSDTVTFSNTVSGDGSVVIGPSPGVTRGAGTIIFTGTNTYTGATVLNAGTLSISSDTNIGASTTLTFGGGVLQVTGNAISNLNNRTVNWGSFTGGLDVASAANIFTVTNYVTGGALNKLGAGTLVLSGSNTVNGSLAILGGKLVISSATSLQNATVSNMVSGGLVLNDPATAWTFGGLVGTGDLGLTNASGNVLTLTVGGNNASTVFGGVLGANGTLIKTGTGTLALTNAGNALGGVTVNNGILYLGAGSAAPGTNVIGSAIVTNNATVVIGASAGSALYSNQFVGTGILIVSNTIVAYLSGSNTYLGGTFLSTGSAKIAAGNDSALGSGSLTFLGSGSSLSATGNAARTLANNLAINTNIALGDSVDTGLLNLTGNADLGGLMRRITVSSPVILAGTVGNGGLVKLGAGTLVLSNANTYALGTTNSQGMIALGVDNPLGSGFVVMSGGGLQSADSAAHNLTNSLLFTSNAILGVSGTGNLTLSGDADLGGVVRGMAVSNGTTTLSGALGNGGLAKAGPGTLVLSGPNTYAGGTIISNGTLQLGSAAAGLNAGAVTVNGGTYDLGGQLGVTNGAIVLASGAITNGTLVGTSYLVGSGNINASLGGAGSLAKTGATSVVTLFGANTYGGGTFVTNGILSLGAVGALPSIGGVTVAGGTLNLGGFTMTNGAVSVTGGSIPLSNGTLVASSYDFNTGSGTATNLANLGGAGGLTKSGAGSLLLAVANSYSGGTVLNAGGGTLLLGHDSALGSGALTWTSGVLGVSSTRVIGNAIQMGGGGAGASNSFALTSGDLTLTGLVTLAGDTLVFNGTGNLYINGAIGENAAGRALTVSVTSPRTVQMSGNNTYTGGTLINLNSGGSALLGGSNASPVTLMGNLTGNGLALGNDYALGTGVFTWVSGMLAANGTRVIGNPILLGATGDTNGFNVAAVSGNKLTLTGLMTMAGNSVINSGGGSADDYAPVLAGGITDLGSNFSLTFIGGNGRVMILSNQYSYGGGTFINPSGANYIIVKLGTNDALPMTKALTVDSPGNAGTGGFWLNGFNQTVGSLGGTGIVSLAGGTLTVGDAGSSTFSGRLVGAGNLTKQGSGTFTVSGTTNTFSGFTTVNDGTLVVGSQNALTNSTLVYTNGIVVFAGGITSFSLGGLVSSFGIGLTNADGTGIQLTVGNNGSLSTVNGALSQGGALTKAGAGTLVLNGNNTYQGATVVSGGTLVLNGDNSGLTNTITVGSGSVTNAGNLSASGLVMGNASGAVGFFTASGGNIAVASNLIVGSAAGGAGTFTIVGGTNLFTPPAGSSGTMKLGAATSSTGTLVMVGGVLDTTSNVTLEVARAGVGTLILSNNAILAGGDITVAANATGRGTLNMYDASSLTGALAMGPGTSTVTVAGGTFYESGSLNMILANGASALGTLLVRGGLFTNSAGASVTLGNNGGSASIVVDGGSYLSPGGNLSLGGTSGSRGAVTVTGGLFSVAANAINIGSAGGSVGTFYVGSNGTAALTASSPAAINVGNSAGSTGTLTVAGGNLTVGGFPLNIGGSGFGTLNVSNGLMTVNSGLVVGNGAGSTGVYNHAGGTLVDTNAAGTATLVVGQAGVGTFTMKGGTVMVDALVATNNVSDSYTNSYVGLGGGTLVTRSAYLNLLGNSFNFGTNGLVWNATGTNQVLGTASFVNIGSGGANALNLSGSGTLWTNNGSLRVGISPNGSNQLNITAGAQAYSSGAQIGAANSSNNMALVAGDGSLWYVSGAAGNADMMVGAQGAGNLLLVSNGGAVYSGGLIMGNLAGSPSNRVVVTGPGAVYNTTGSANIGNSAGSGGQAIVVSNGAVLVTATASLGQNAAAGNNSLWVGGAANGTNAQWITQGNAGDHTYIGYSSPSNQLTVAAGGSVFTPMMTLGVNAGSFANVIAVNGGSLVVTNVGSPGVGILEAQWGTLAISSGSVVVTKLLLATNAGNEGTLNWTGGSLSVGSLGASSNDAGAILQSLIGSGLGSVSTQTISYSVNANPVFNSDVVLGLGAGGKGALSIGGGTFTVTNAAGTGTLTVGQAGAGTLTLSGGAIVLDQLIATNNVAGSYTNSLLRGSDGSISLLHGSAISALGNFMLASAPGGTVGWNYLGGTNVTATTGILSVGTNAARASVTVNGPGTVWSNNGTAFYVGWNSSQNQMLITNGGIVYSGTNTIIGYLANGVQNSVRVTGPGSLWNVAGSLDLGNQGSLNTLTIADGATVSNLNTVMGEFTPGTSNAVLVTGSGSRWAVGGTLSVGYRAGNNVAIITNGGVLTAGTQIRVGNVAGGDNNLLLISGSNTVVGGASVIVGNVSGNNQLIVNDGALLTNGASAVLVGNNAASSINNSILVTDPGTRWLMAGDWNMGYTGPTNSATISNGAIVSNLNAFVGKGVSSLGNSVLVTGSGSLWASAGIVYLGSNGSSSVGTGGGRVLVTGGGILQATNISLGYAGSGVLTNNGGVLRFTANNPTITTNTAGSLVVMDGTVEFAGVDSANVTGQISRISYSGNNTLRLNAATNSALDWTVSNGMSFSTLELMNDGSMWRGSSLLVADGGTLRASNANATLAAVLTNAGTVSVVNGQLTYLSNVVLNGGVFLTRNGTNNFTGGLGLASGGVLTFTTGTSRVEGSISNSGTINAVNANVTFGGPVLISGLYASDPSTNTFASNVTVTASGALSGGVGDLFVFQKDLFMQSTNATQFNLFQSAVLFSNGPNHLLSISNSGALNLGQGFTSFSQVATNFALGQLSIASGDRLTIAGNKDSLTNALYVGWLDIQGGLTNSFDAATNSLFLALNLANVNLYYDTYDPRNAWLNQWIPDTGYDLWGGGLLLPIPEPSTWMGLGGGLALLAFLRRRKD